MEPIPDRIGYAVPMLKNKRVLVCPSKPEAWSKVALRHTTTPRMRYFVIAIIAILAAILFPARAREAARQASRQSNLKQYATGTPMYIQSYNER
jgi:hypothetical protein